MTIQMFFQSLEHRRNAIRTQGSWAAPLLTRITLGVLFLSTGWGKVHNIANVTRFFGELGIPAAGFNAALVSYVELIGGALLLLGLAVELAALPLICSMFVAILTAKREEVRGLADLFGLVEWTYLVLLVWLMAVGAGRASLGYVLKSRVNLGKLASGKTALPEHTKAHAA